jgi:hypothetical protein
MNCKGFGKKRSYLIEVMYRNLPAGNEKKLRKPVRTACGPTEIRTGLDRHLYIHSEPTSPTKGKRKTNSEIRENLWSTM